MLYLALVTANFGGIDTLKPLPQDAGFGRFYYTDEATLTGRPTRRDVRGQTTMLDVPQPPTRRSLVVLERHVKKRAEAKARRALDQGGAVD